MKIFSRASLILMILSFFLLVFTANPKIASAGILSGACNINDASKTSAVCNQDGSDPIGGKDGVLLKVSKVIAFFAGFAAVVSIMIAGIMFATSDGDPQKIKSARNTIVYAIVGVVVILAAQSIILLVVNRL